MEERKLTLGSLFDGSGGFPLGGLLAGIQPKWASEVEPFCIRVTTKRLPFVKHYGDIHEMNDSRYHCLNYHATFTKGTIEFRLFQFANPMAERKSGLHGGELKSYIQLCLALSEMAKSLKTASPKEPQHEDPKFAMRTWLMRMGFIGKEFATARDILTRNLSGDAAFRFGRSTH